jgi:hypothetical protein
MSVKLPTKAIFIPIKGFFLSKLYTTMDSYSHGTFQVSGYNVTISSPQEAQAVIQKAWHKFMQEGLSKQVEHKAYPHVHCVYHNYTNLGNPEKEGYDMILGFVTEDGSTQSSPEFMS